MDTYAATEQLAVARLHWVLDDDWIGSCRLRCVPGVYLLIDRRQGIGFVDELLSFSVTWLGGEQGQRGQADVRLQRLSLIHI